MLLANIILLGHLVIQYAMSKKGAIVAFIIPPLRYIFDFFYQHLVLVFKWKNNMDQF